jgi:two-component system chemotaxis sensor kinase CheA
MIEQAVDGIEAGQGEGIEPAALVAQLQTLAHGDGAPALASDPAVTSAVPLPDASALPEGLDLLHVRVDVDAACESASIRVYMAYNAIESASEPVWSHPAPEDLDEWEQPHLDVLVAREGDDLAAQLEEVVRRIPEIATVTVVPFVTAPTEIATPAEPALAPTPAEPAAELRPTRPVVEQVAEQPAAPEVPAPAAAAAATPAVKQRKSGTIRVDAARLDALMHLMGEVIVHRSTVETHLRERDVDRATEAVQELRRSTQALQAEVMNVRMVPVETALMRMPRLVRDLSAKLSKDVELVITGADTEIDRSVVDALGDPLVHLVRNGLDHGIETPEERVAAGKPPRATLTISAEHAGGNVVISVLDDGRGIDPEKVKARAVERGIITREEATLLDDQGAVELVFRAGFSTAEVATDVSGRGVGMDAVRAMCREWGGDVEMESTPGHGSVARIRIPLTLAVMTVLVVKAGRSNVAIPIDRIERTIRLADHPRVAIAGGQRMVRLDEGVLGEVDLGDAVGYGVDPDPTFGVIVHAAGGRRVVLAVSGLVGEHEAVTKPLPAGLGDEAAFVGAAVQGDGSVVLIVDCDHVVEGGGRTPGAADAPVLAARTEGGGVHA